MINKLMYHSTIDREKKNVNFHITFGADHENASVTYSCKIDDESSSNIITENLHVPSTH